MIKSLCQRDYDQLVLSAAEKELYILKQARLGYPKALAENIFDTLHPERKKHVIPITESDEEFAKRWEQVKYERKPFNDNLTEYYTEKGERVRSKTEILIANALHRHNIPYRYEAPIYLSGAGKIHPDFTALNVKERKEIYWEHLGMMDSPEYSEKALNRILIFQRNHIFPGDRLILTHETARNPVDSRMIEQMILHYFK